MPGTTGIVLVNKIREFWPGLPVILATGYADLPDAEIAGVPRLSKPYRLNTLSTVLTEVCSGKAVAAAPRLSELRV